MTLIYTSRQAIAQLLSGRLTIGGSAAAFGPPVVNDGLIDQIGEQVEARVTAALATRYKLPIKNPANPLIASAVEQLILCRILSIHAIGEEQTTSSNQGVDRSYTGASCVRGEAELKALVTGAIALDGETLINEQVSPTGAANFSGARVRSSLGTRDAREVQF
ncbi:MAG TPA: hypothetical protein V6C88_17360 [Chroococcidiopsis sp.]